MKRKYFSMEKFDESATINIYGDITSYPWNEGDMSSANLSKQLESLGDVKQIDVFVNSYGGEVAEGLAIYNALRRHKAKITTHCDGFACSIASVIFMAGDERIMNESSLLMIHNAWTIASGNSKELRKQADDLEKITQASVEAYKAHSSLSEEEIKELMDAETWILPSEAAEYGFATAIESSGTKNASQNAWMQIFELITKAKQEEAEEAEEDDSEEEPQEPETEDEGEAEPEEPDGDPEEDPEEDPDEEPEEKSENAAQRWSGFFYAILS